MTRSVFAFILFALVCLTAHAEPTGRGPSNSPLSAVWNPDLTTERGRIAALAYLAQLHPNLPVTHFNHAIDLYKALEIIPGLRESLGDNAAPLRMREALYTTVEYTPNGDWAYNPQAVDKGKEDLVAKLRALPLENPTTLVEDLRKLRNPRDQDLLFHLVPFLYDPEGRARVTKLDAAAKTALEAHIRSLSPGRMDAEYRRSFNDHYLDLTARAWGEVKNEPAAKWRKSGEKSLSSSAAINGLRPVQPDGKDAERRFLSLEEVHPLDAVFRAYWFRDCSSCTARNFVLGKGVKVYAVRKSADRNSQPVGYVVDVPQPHKENTISFIAAGIGDDLTTADYQHAMKLLAHVHGETHVITPNTEDENSPHSDKFTEAGRFPRPQRLDFQAPAWWVKLDKDSRAADPDNHIDVHYWAPENLTGLRVSRVETPDPKWGAVTVRDFAWTNQPASGIERVPLFNRAVLAAKVLSPEPGTDLADRQSLRAHLMEELKVSEAQINTVLPFMNKPRAELTPDDFRAMQREFGIKLRDLYAFMDVYQVAELAIRWHGQDASLATPDEWRGLFTRIQRNTRADLADEKNANKKSNYTRVLARIPQAYNDLTPADFGVTHTVDELRTMRIEDRAELLAKVLADDKLPLPLGTHAENRQALLGLLNVPENYAEASQILAKLGKPGARLTKADYLKLNAVYGITPMNLMNRFDIHQSGKLLLQLYQDDPNLIPDAEWKQVFRAANRLYRRALAEQVGPQGLATADGYYDAQLQLPEPFLAIQWDRALKHAPDAADREAAVTKIISLTHWDNGVWDAVLNGLDGKYLTDRQRSSLWEAALQRKPWSPRWFRFFDGVIEKAVKESANQNWYWPGAEASWAREMLAALGNQPAWPRETWAALTEALEKLGPIFGAGNMRKVIMELMREQTAWPSEFRDRIVAVMRSSSVAADRTRALMASRQGEPAMLVTSADGGPVACRRRLKILGGVQQ